MQLEVRGWLIWHELQPGLSRPVALLIDEGHTTEDAANAAGYRYFTEAERFRDYVRREVLVLEAVGE